ncbi:MAG TPA: PAS domain S-box protein [Candidatus Polarisedimenticolia bacterium]|nr:PAS domain S-box protein [Candidatus Polarisedimenticolia bacterium]
MKEIHQATDTETESPERKLAHFERRFRLLDEHLRLLERERQKLSAIVHHTDAGFLVLDASLKVTWANSIFAREFSRNDHPGALVGAACNTLLCGEASICSHCPAARPFTTGKVAHHEMRLETEAQTRALYVTAMPIRSLTGETDQCIVMVQDVSDLEVLRSSQQALKESEERFRSIFEHAASGMTAVSPDGVLLQVNPAFCRFLGYSAEELIGRNVVDITDPADREPTRKLVAAGRDGSKTAMEMEKRYLRKDGSIAWGHISITWIRDAEGKPIVAVGLVEDIGERKHAEEALRQSEARKGAILDTALDAIITIDQAGIALEFNPAAEQLFGHRREEVLGRNILELIVPPEEQQKIREGLQKFFLTGESPLAGRHVEMPAMHRDGTRFPVEFAVSRIQTTGPPAFTAYIRDLTEQRQAEEALRQREDQLRHSQKMEAIGTLAGGVAHDFNNLLTGILGYAELLKLGSRPGEKVFQSAEVIEKAASRAASLTQQLLGFARRGKHQNVSLDLHASIQEVTGLLGRTLDKSINLRQELCTEPVMIQGDPGQMGQVILNLAVNAADAMTAGGDLVFRTSIVKLTDDQRARHAGHNGAHHVLLSVTDSGCGIPSDVLPRVFEPFFTTKERGKGTGMGLAMVYGIVQNHGGFIEIDTTVGHGTTFRLYFPEASRTDRPQSARLAAGQSRAGSGTVLVVDDEESVRCVATAFLEEMGYTVLTAKDGEEAVQIYRGSQVPIDLVIIDMIMPKLGGRDCFRALKKVNPEVRAIISTGYDVNAAAQEILDEGMRGFIQKPYLMRQLSDVVSAALKS